MQPDTIDDRQAKERSISRLTRFGLRTLLIVVAFCAVLLAWWRDRSQLKERLRQSELLREMTLPDKDEQILLEKRLLDELCELDHDLWRPLRPSSDDDNATSSANVKHIISMLVDSKRTPEDRGYAATLLGNEHGDEALSALIEALKDDPLVRKSAILSLGRFGRRAAPAISALKIGLDDPQSSMAARTVWALWRIDPAPDLLPRIEQLLQDDDVEARRLAAYTLVFSDYPRALPLLTEMLRDPDSQVRLVAAYGVMNTAAKEQAVRTLVDAGTDESDPRVRSCIRMALQLLQLGRGRRQREEIEAEYRAAFPEIARISIENRQS
jgi:HEAT repeat protein